MGGMADRHLTIVTGASRGLGLALARQLLEAGDTDMQAQLRQADPGRFPDLGHFQELQRRGMLSAPEAAAARVLAFLNRADYGSAPVADVRD